jgi:excisionase family DNA binding protein
MTLPVIQNVEKRAYSVEEISAQTTLSKAFLRKEIKEKRLKVQRFGRRVLILSEDLEAYLYRQRDEQF